MNFNWYQIFNLPEFLEAGLVSRKIQVNLAGIGLKEILIVKGTSTGVVYEDLFLSLNVNGNPFYFGEHALYLDPSNNVWLGTPI